MHSLPELGGWVNGLEWLEFSVHQLGGAGFHGGVLGQCAVPRVPRVVTAVPGQVRGEGGKEVVEGPGQDHVVVAVEEEHDDGARVAYPWSTHTNTHTSGLSVTSIIMCMLLAVSLHYL